MSSFNNGNSKLPMEYNLQFFAERNPGNSKPPIPLNLQYFASEGGSKSTEIAPAFDNIGLGTQYRSPVSVEVLLKRGIIKKVGGN